MRRVWLARLAIAMTRIRTKGLLVAVTVFLLILLGISQFIQQRGTPQAAGVHATPYGNTNELDSSTVWSQRLHRTSDDTGNTVNPSTSGAITALSSTSDLNNGRLMLTSTSNVLQEHDQDQDHLIHSQLQICSRLATDREYENFVAAYLEAWNTFVPSHNNLLPNFTAPCWHASMLLPPPLMQALTDWWNLRDIEEKYPTKQALLIIQRAQYLTGHTLQRYYEKNYPRSRNHVIPFEKHDRVAVIRRSSLFGSNGRTTRSFGQFLCLPTIFLLGFPKCGTTTLYNYITKHPGIAQPQSKEGQFWRDFMKTESEVYKKLMVLHYLFHFKPAANIISENPQVRTIDASASTIFASPHQLQADKDVCTAPVALSKALPEAKLIVIMRNPVDRLWSDYWFFCSRCWKIKGTARFNIPEYYIQNAPMIFHNKTASVIHDFNVCLGMNKSEFECVMRANSDDAKAFGCDTVRLGIGLYYFHLVKWMSVFPRKQLLILRMEEFITDPHNVMDQVWEFLEVEPLSRDAVNFTRLTLNGRKTNANTWISSEKYREKFHMLPETRELLTLFYRPYNERLARLLDDLRFLWA